MIIGEAMTRLSADMEQEMPEVPWEQIRGFRNRIVHGYFALKLPVVWHIATVEIAPLRGSAEALLARNHPETHRRWNERIIAGKPDDAL